MAEQRVVTELVIDSDQAVASSDRYIRKMSETGQATQDVRDAQRDLALALAGVSAAMAASMRDQSRAANDNAKSWEANGLEIASVTNHLKQVAIAAYAVSPAFREMVNPAITASVRATSTALSAMGPAAASAGLAAVRGMSPLLSLAGRILLPITLVIDTFRVMAAITELGAEKMKELNAVSESAAARGVGVEFFQRQAKAADDMVGKVDLATEALKRFNAVSQDKLGGSDLSNRIDQLAGAGNFAGNAGVDAYKSAVTTEERYRAIVTLISEAMDKGERLAALDLAAKFLPPELTERLRQNGQLLREMQDAADKVKLSQIASAEDVGYAVDLKRRLEEANKVIADGLKPLQRDLTQLGLNYQESWVVITEYEARAVTLANQLYEALKGIPGVLADAGNAPIWQKLIDASKAAGLYSRPEGLVMRGEPEFAASTGEGSKANSALKAALSDTNAVKRAMQDAIDVQTKLRGEISKPIVPGAAKAAVDTKDAYDRAKEAVEKHTARIQADAQAAGLGAGALEEFRARAQLMTAAMQAGREVTPELAAEIEQLAKRAREAGIELDRVREQQARLGALAGAATNAFTTIVDGFTSGKKAGEVFISTLDSVGSSLKNIGADSMSKGLKGLFSGQGLTGFDPASLGIGAIGIGVSLISNLFAQDDAAKKKLEEAKRVWKEAGPAFQQFLTEMSGGVQGELMNRVASARQRASELGDKAWEAEDYAAVRRIVDSYSKYVQDQSRAFLATFQATARGLGDGLGMDSPFLKAVSTIKDQLASVQSFVDDTRTSTGILSGALSEDTLALTGNAAAIAYMNGEVAKATDVSRTYLLSLLGTAPQLSTVATRMLDIQGRAAALQGALEQLGMSSGDAAAAIAGGVQKAIADLRKSFEGGLTSRLNTATGKGYMNDALALLAQRNQDIADAASLGLDMNLVSTVFAAEAQKIVDDAGLVGDAFNEFTTIFPDLAGVVTQSASAIEKAAQAQKQALDASAKSILDYLNSLTAGTASTLAPAERLAAAQAAYNAKLTLAQGGNLDAQSSIVQDAENLRLAAQAMYASGAQYQAIVAAIKSQLSGLSSVQQTTDPLLVAMRDVQAAVIGTTTAVHGTTGAVNTTGAANDNLQTVQNQLAAQQVNYLASQQALLGAINNLTVSGNTTADRIINAINGLGRLTYDATQSQNDLLLLMVFALGGHGSPPPIPGWPGFQNGGVIPGYATGGMIGNGIYGIDSVVARLPNGRPIGLAGGEFVMPADQTRRFLPQLEGMRQGRPTGESLDWQPLARAIKQAIDISDERLLAKIDELIASNEASAPRIKDALRQIVAGAKPRAA